MQIIGIIGAGAMGTGIAQVATLAGCEVRIYDTLESSITRSRDKLLSILNMLATKGKITDTEAKAAFARVYYIHEMSSFRDCELIIEAVIEDLEIKKEVFTELQKYVNESCVLATNTSSLSVTAISQAIDHKDHFLGIHFFNPPGLMPLVEIIQTSFTDKGILNKVRQVIDKWGKVTVLVKDSPGFIVNKVARPFYSEALRILEEGIATAEEIDWVMTEKGGFNMGPFTLMDYIGHDVNYAVTSSVWEAHYFDSRYRPSIIQKRLVESGQLGKKSGKGFYDYSKDQKPVLQPVEDQQAEDILLRILTMLINEAADTIYKGICSEKDLELAVLKGVRYPKGLLQWGKELGYAEVVEFLDHLYYFYHEERYRVSPWLRNKAKNIS